MQLDVVPRVCTGIANQNKHNYHEEALDRGNCSPLGLIFARATIPAYLEKVILRYHGRASHRKPFHRRICFRGLSHRKRGIVPNPACPGLRANSGRMSHCQAAGLPSGAVELIVGAACIEVHLSPHIFTCHALALLPSLESGVKEATGSAHVLQHPPALK